MTTKQELEALADQLKVAGSNLCKSAETCPAGAEMKFTSAVVAYKVGDLMVRAANAIRAQEMNNEAD